MKIGACQFKVTNHITKNLEIMKRSILDASSQGVSLLVFPECAFTGYPPRDIETSSAVNFEELEKAHRKMQCLSNQKNMHIIAGTIIQNEKRYFNSAMICSPGRQPSFYHKRALWGWDRDNFTAADSDGILEVDGWRIGIRICFEVRFPEYFRELYRVHTDLNIILFYDVSEQKNPDRYDLIESHIRTRAVENVTYTLTVNTASFYQTAPTALYDRSGKSIAKLNRNQEEILTYNLEKSSLNFGEQGRQEISEELVWGWEK
ncbi:MAG TPA: carbon-nitrogen hydrolase family protein [Candidatus Pullilachnospira intestinigallinarum]|nr:carbon-nitrogen hydrolase family protein [Candidatus Pullilachnospira intestinigallinarum]